MPAASGRDLVRLLIEAADEGLLRYIGCLADGGYQVELSCGERRVAPELVEATVAGLRAVRELGETLQAHARVRHVSVRDVWTVEVGPRDAFAPGGRGFFVPVGDVVAWTGGFVAGSLRGGQEHAGLDALGPARELLTDPPMMDQAVMAILGLMYGRRPGVSMPELASRVERTKKTVVAALHFGGRLSPQMASAMVRALGGQLLVGVSGYRVVGAGDEETPQAPGVQRMRVLVQADAEGLLRYVGPGSGPVDPNWLRRVGTPESAGPRVYEVAVGPRVYWVPAGQLQAWVDGLGHAAGGGDVG